MFDLLKIFNTFRWCLWNHYEWLGFYGITKLGTVPVLVLYVIFGYATGLFTGLECTHISLVSTQIKYLPMYINVSKKHFRSRTNMFYITHLSVMSKTCHYQNVLQFVLQ